MITPSINYQNNNEVPAPQMRSLPQSRSYDNGIINKYLEKYIFQENSCLVKNNMIEAGVGSTLCPILGAIRIHKFSNKSLLRARPFTSNQLLFQSSQLAEASGHILTVAPTRSGKTSAQVITNLLEMNCSMLVIDPKGEIFEKTSGYRHNNFNQKIFKFSPFKKHTHIWNPIAKISPNDQSLSIEEKHAIEEENITYLVTLIIEQNNDNRESFWNNSAKDLLKGLLLYVCTGPLIEDSQDNTNSHYISKRTIGEVIRLILLSDNDFKYLILEMKNSDRHLVKTTGEYFHKHFESDNNKLLQSIFATILQHLSVWNYQRLNNATNRSLKNTENAKLLENDFDFKNMLTENTTIYIEIPPEFLTEYSQVLRVLIGFAMREIKTNYDKLKEDINFKEIPPVLFILDEFALLGHMKPIEDALAYVAGYHVRLWFFIQNIGQLQENYPKSYQTFLANTDFKCFFGINDLQTANKVSEMIGDQYVEYTSDGFSHSNSETYKNYDYFNQIDSQSNSNSYSQSKTLTSLKALTPQDLMSLENNYQIIFIRGSKPILCMLYHYFKDDLLNIRSKLSIDKMTFKREY